MDVGFALELAKVPFRWLMRQQWIITARRKTGHLPKQLTPDHDVVFAYAVNRYLAFGGTLPSASLLNADVSHAVQNAIVYRDSGRMLEEVALALQRYGQIDLVTDAEVQKLMSAYEYCVEASKTPA